MKTNLSSEERTTYANASLISLIMLLKTAGVDSVLVKRELETLQMYINDNIPYANAPEESNAKETNI